MKSPYNRQTLIVVFNEFLTKAQQKRFLEENGFVIKSEYQLCNGYCIYVPDTHTERVAEILRQLPEIAGVDFNYFTELA